MKRLFIFALSALLFAFVGMAFAQVSYDNPCGVPIPPGERKPYTDFASGTVPYQCAPVPTATSTWPTVRYSTAGAVGWWYCKVGPKWYANWVAGTNDFLFTNNVAGEALAASANFDPVKALNAVAKKYITLPLSDPSLTPIWCPVQAEMYAARPADDVAPPVPTPDIFRTPVIGTFTLYMAANGTLTGLLTGRKASPNALCDCTAKVAVGSASYCPLAGGNPAEVTLCRKAP